ncbi:hypothetical protein TrVE_jg8318 [Triparma verrucosa]|uniref:DUF4485 domain-containing protein n=1 Tax=Triparma verrucosa TaxID=1606542 RepID=A0A9W7C6S3_9STRA|nr:hypothetical protein TrVE_jg8318 [Triparma verrucosa]
MDPPPSPTTPITQPPPTPSPPLTNYQSALLSEEYRLQQKNYDANVPYPSVQGGDALNDEFAMALVNIESSYVHLPKAYRIRIENWVRKLSAPMPTLSWRRNRNAYAHLLASSIRSKDFREPFHRSPPDGPLQMLGAHLKVKAGEEGLKSTNRFWAGIHKKVGRMGEDNEGQITQQQQMQMQQTQMQVNQNDVVDDIVPNSQPDEEHDIQSNQSQQQQQPQQTNPPTIPNSRQPTPSITDDLTVNTSTSIPGIATSTTGVESNFDHVIRVGEMGVQTSRPPSQASVASGGGYGISTQTSVNGKGGRAGRNSRRGSRDLSVGSFEEGSEALHQSLLRTGFTPLPTIIHSPNVRKGGGEEEVDGGGGAQGDEVRERRRGSVRPGGPVGVETPANASDSFVADMFPPQMSQQTPFTQQRQQQQQQQHSYQQQPPNPYVPTPAYQLTAPPSMPQTHLGPQNPPFPEPTTLPPEMQELQHIVSAQTSRLQLLQDQLSSQQLAHALEIQRIQSQHIMEMQQLRKMHEQQLERFRMNHASGGAGSKPGTTTVTGVPGQRKAWDASQLPLEQYLEYLDKFQQDATVLSTLAKQDNPLPGGEESFMAAGGGQIVPY